MRAGGASKFAASLLVSRGSRKQADPPNSMHNGSPSSSNIGWQHGPAVVKNSVTVTEVPMFSLQMWLLGQPTLLSSLVEQESKTGSEDFVGLLFRFWVATYEKPRG